MAGSWRSTWYLSKALKLGCRFTSRGFTGRRGRSHALAVGCSCLLTSRIVGDELVDLLL